MELVVAIIILLIVLIVLALAVFLILTIVELVKINRGLDRVLVGVSEIATKTAPVNGVLDAINRTLLAGRDLLEGLALKKAGPDAAGLVESCYPGEGQRFLQRVGRNGEVVAIGEDYDRGAAILNSLLGAGPAPPPPVATRQAAASDPSAAGRSGGRISLRNSSPPASNGNPTPPADGSPAVGGRISLRKSSPPASNSNPTPPADGSPAVGGRMSVKSARPWE